MSQPPISPGFTAEPTAATPAPQKRRSPVVAIVAAAAVLTIALAAAVVWALTQDEVPLPGPLEQKTQLRAAYETCNRVGELSDADKTMFLDGEGNDSGSGTLDTGQIVCILEALDTPTYVTTAMENTRALDGRQSEEWEGFETSWTFHPDEGLNVLIREVG